MKWQSNFSPMCFRVEMLQRCSARFITYTGMHYARASCTLTYVLNFRASQSWKGRTTVGLAETCIAIIIHRSREHSKFWGGGKLLDNSHTPRFEGRIPLGFNPGDVITLPLYTPKHLAVKIALRVNFYS